MNIKYLDTFNKNLRNNHHVYGVNKIETYIRGPKLLFFDYSEY